VTIVVYIVDSGFCFTASLSSTTICSDKKKGKISTQRVSKRRNKNNRLGDLTMKMPRRISLGDELQRGTLPQQADKAGQAIPKIQALPQEQFRVAQAPELGPNPQPPPSTIIMQTNFSEIFMGKRDGKVVVIKKCRGSKIRFSSETWRNELNILQDLQYVGDSICRVLERLADF
jgi:hypothetical protein